MKKSKGFTLIELVIVIVLLGILAAAAVPYFIDLQSDARKVRMEGIGASIRSGMDLSHANNVIAGRDKGNFKGGSDFDLDGDGNAEVIYYGYPIIYNSDTLLDLIYLDICIIEQGSSCSDETIKLLSELKIIENYNTIYTLSDVSADALNECAVIIENVKLDSQGALISVPNIMTITTSC